MFNWSEKLYKQDISFVSIAAQSIISDPGAGKRIAIDMINFIPTAACSVQLGDGDTAYGGNYPLGANQSFVLENAIQNYDGIITLSINEAFKMTTSVATQTSGFVRYRILDNS